MFQLKVATVTLIVLTNLWFNSPVNAKFPDDPKPCKYGDSPCIVKLINYFLHEKNQGDSSINLVNIDPLSVSKISIKQGAESAVNIDLTFSKNTILGLKDSTAYKVKGFGKEPGEKHEIHLKLKTVSLVGDYKINGKVLILPISGNGKSNITMVNSELALHFSGTPFKKDGSTYMKITNMKIDVEPERIYYHYGNLFNGDKILGESMNAFLNENWKEIFMEVKESMTSAFAKIFQSVINNVFSKYPYENFFS